MPADLLLNSNLSIACVNGDWGVDATPEHTDVKLFQITSPGSLRTQPLRGAAIQRFVGAPIRASSELRAALQAEFVADGFSFFTVQGSGLDTLQVAYLR
jgi:hypothetical protein